MKNRSGDYVVVQAESLEQDGRVMRPVGNGTVVFRGSKEACINHRNENGGKNSKMFISLSVSRKLGQIIPYKRRGA